MIATIPAWLQVVLWPVGVLVLFAVAWALLAQWSLGRGQRPNTSVKKHEQRDED